MHIIWRAAEYDSRDVSVLHINGQPNEVALVLTHDILRSNVKNTTGYVASLLLLLLL